MKCKIRYEIKITKMHMFKELVVLPELVVTLSPLLLQSSKCNPISHLIQKLETHPSGQFIEGQTRHTLDLPN
jgi:hypothetical protein